jgi:hypothetical protein
MRPMIKSRMALLALSAGAAAWPGAAFAQSPAASAEQAIAAYDLWYEEVTDGAGATGVRRCRRETGGDEIVVCGRSDDSRMRVPYEPVPGARVRLIAGEVPSAMGALNAGGTPRGGGIDVIGLAKALGRGLDRILHPD